MTDSILRSYQSYSHTSMVPFPAIILLLDAYPNALFAYSFRKLRAGYGGSAVRIRRDSDNSEQDIGFAGTDFDAAGAASFIGGGNGFLTKWYDQSGNGLDGFQATAGNQQQYTASGIGGKPTMTCLGAPDSGFLVSNINFGTSTSGTFFSVLNQDGTKTDNRVFVWHAGATNDVDIAATTTNNLLFDFGSNNASTGEVTVAQPGGWDNTNHIAEFYRETGGTQGITVDGTNLISVSRSDTLTSLVDDMSIQRYTAGFSNEFKGQMSELIGWLPDIGSTSRTAVRNNMNAYYTVF